MQEIIGKYTTARIYADTVEEGVYQQVYDIINCRAFKDQKVVCMPDVHVGASGPCGLVATIGDYVCPEHIGVDIGCTVSMMVLDKKIPVDKYPDFEHKVKTRIPFGCKIQDNCVIDEKDFYRFLTTGFNKYRNYWPEMLGDLPDTVTEKWVSQQLSRIGIDEGVFYKSLGTVGGGNHFIEYDEEKEGDMAGVTLHFGSRNFGLKVCSYWMRQTRVPLTKDDIRRYTLEYKDMYTKKNKDMRNFKEDAAAYIEMKRGEFIAGYLSDGKMAGYLCDMCFAQLYAQYNHQTVQGIIKDILSKYGIKVTRTIVSVHNFIDLHDHTLRKSAIRSYEGEEMLVPFNMRDGIAVCEGLSNPDWLNSCAHGAGRKLSRSKAKASVSMEEFRESMKDVYSTTVCESTIDESPMAYKDTSEIASLITETCKIKFFMVPRINIKDPGKKKDDSDE